MPFREQNGTVVLVDLGWVPQTSPTPAAVPPGITIVTGYLHSPNQPGLFAAPDDPAHNLYYTLDPARIGVGLGFASVAPFTLIAMGPLPPPGSPLPQPAQELPHPPNNHYGYALTWFGFAGVLVFQFFFFARKRLLEP
jgi:surfeit locus 1 family protein